MAQDVGIAYVTVAPSARGFGKAVEGEVDAGVGGATKKADGRLKTLAKNTAKWGAVAVGAVAASVTALAVKGGIDRALNIEDAQAKLKGLGHDAASVDQIMTDALASVRGTAYGLDSAATTAASAVAAGIKPGKELEGYLRLTADAATIAGVSMDEMGDIINQVSARGTASMQHLNRLTQRGVPIMQMLSDEYGVTAEEMSKMVSRGEVDAERFRAALESGVGGAALASGDTTRGAFANMGAALSRLGLTVVQPFLDNAKDLFGELTVIIDGLNERLGPFAERFSEWFGGKMADALDGFGERFLAFVDSVTAGESPMGNILTILAPLGDVLRGAGPALSQLGEQFQRMGEILGGALVTLLPVIVEAFAGLLDAVIPLVPVIGEALVGAVEALAPHLPTLVEAFATLLDAAVELVPTLGEALVTAIEAVAPLLPLIADALVEIVDAAEPLIPVLIEALEALLPVLLDLIPPLVDILTPALEWMAWYMANINGPAVEFLAKVISDYLVPALEWVIEKVRDLLDWIANMGDKLSGVRDTIMSAFSNPGEWLKDVGRKLIGGLMDGIQSRFGDVKKQLNRLTSSLPDWKGPAETDARLLTNSGRLIMGSLMDGFKAEEGAVRNYLQGFTGDLALSGSVTASTTSGSSPLGRSDLDYLADRIARLMGLESERGTSRALSGVSALSNTFGRMA